MTNYFDTTIDNKRFVKLGHIKKFNGKKYRLTSIKETKYQAEQFAKAKRLFMGTSVRVIKIKVRGKGYGSSIGMFGGVVTRYGIYTIMG